MKDQSRNKQANPLKAGIGLFLIGIIFLVTFPFWILLFIRDIFLRFKFYRAAVTQDKFIILVYSNSPNWKSYIEENILPQVQDHAILLNWSERAHWNNVSWAVQSFHHWGGQHAFNPLAIVYCRFFDVRVIRFFHAFQELKHGKANSLQKAEAQLFDLAKTRDKANLNKI